MASFMDFFQISLGSLTREKRDLVQLEASSTIQATIEIFNEQKVSSIPIYEISQGTNEAFCHDGKSYVGLVSMADIAVYIISLEKSFVAQDGAGKSVTQCLNDPVREAIGYAAESGMYIGFSIEHDDTPLSKVVERMCVGMHRCLVFGDNSHAPRILTQTDIVKYFLENIDVHPQISTALSHHVSATPHGKDLVCVHEHSPAFQALEKLRYVSALAVINENGQIVTTLSPSDVCHLSHTSDFNAIVSMTVKEFLTMASTDGIYPKVPICATNESEARHCAEIMLEHHIHRLWVVGQHYDTGVERYASGCVSLTDIINIVQEHSAVYIAGDYII